MGHSLEGHLDGKVAIVTGGGSGIGRAIADELVDRGCRVVLAGRTADKLITACNEMDHGVMAIPVPTQVSDRKQVTALVNRAVDHFGRLDIVVNNAGVAPLEPIGEQKLETIEQCFEVNALGAAYLITAAWPHLIRESEGKRGGCIVNISTMGTFEPFPGFFAYASSKAAVNLMAKSAANEGAAYGIRAFAVAPGAVETPMLRGLFDTTAIPPEKALKPQDIGKVVLDCITGERDGDNGSTIPVPSP